MDIPDKIEAKKAYEDNLPSFARALAEMRRSVEKSLEGLQISPSIKSRIKDFNSLFKKRIRLLQRTAPGNPLPINDLIGIRIICPFLEDLKVVEERLRRDFRVVEVERKGSELSFKEFGYESTHLLVDLPEGIEIDRKLCTLAEIQVRTILQDAWAEVEHELVYKAEFNPFDEPLKRKLAALNANLSLSDMIFQEIRDYQHQLNNELLRRRETFFDKVESSMDNFSPGPAYGANPVAPRLGAAGPVARDTIDAMLLDALLAHNNNDFARAISIYTEILSLDPKDEVKAIIRKHRGMAYFAEDRYDEALDDFSASISLSPGNARAYYFRAVVLSVKCEYGLAISDFDRSLELNPYQFFALYRRAQAFYHIGDHPKALADCDHALRLDPESKQAILFRDHLKASMRM